VIDKIISAEHALVYLTLPVCIQMVTF